MWKIPNLQINQYQLTEYVWSFIHLYFCEFLYTLFCRDTSFSNLFYKHGFVDNPEKYGKERKPVPYSMGIIFFLTFFILSYFFIEYTYKLGLIWFFWGIISIVSFVDDRLNVSAKIRLVLQILIWAVIALSSIKIWYVSSIFWGIVDLETVSLAIWSYTFYIIPFAFTVLWYVFIFNALNWTDGLSGNTSGLSIISFFILFLLWYILFTRDTYQWWLDNAIFVMKICIILVWILLPFWYFDVREKILMWDSGTMFLWFMLATIAIISWWKIATVLVVFWIYSVDAIYVVLKRIISKKNPLKGDFTHLHHRLAKAWLSKIQFLCLVYSLSFSFWITALFLDRTWKIIVFALIVFIVIFINKIVEKMWKFNIK